MTEYSFEQLVDVEPLRQVLESHHSLSGMAYGLCDRNGNGIVSAGWQDVCTRFHSADPTCFERCRECKAHIQANPHEAGNDFFECHCANGMICAAMPVIIEGHHLATFFTGQFFYADDPPDQTFFLDQACKCGFDPDEYLESLARVPLLSREHVRGNMKFLRSMVRLMAESGLKSIRLGITLASEREQNRLIEEQHAIFGFALDLFHEAAFVIDENGRFQYVNREACRSLGYSRDELTGMTVPDIDPDFTSEMVFQSIKSLHAVETQTFETRHRARDGRIFPVEITSTLFNHNGVSYNLSLARDISERKRAEEKALRTREIFLDTLLDTVPIPIFFKDREGRYLGFNKAFEELFDAPKEQLIGKSVFDINPPELAEIYCCRDAELFERGGIQQYESSVRNMRGELRNVVFNKAVFTDHGGNPSGLIGAIVDITERKRIEEQLRYSEQKFRTLAENSPGMIIRYDRECRRVYVNPAFTSESGIPSGEALGVPVENAWIPGLTVTPGEYEALLLRVMATGAPAEILLEWPNRQTGRLSSHYLHIVAERNADGEITGCLAIDHDITRLRETELKLAKLAETSPGVLFNVLMTTDGLFRMPYSSHRIRELTGLWPEEMEHDMDEVFSRIHPDDLPRFLDSINESARTLCLWHLEFRILHPVKGELWVEGNSIPELQADGGVLWYGFLHDISERKRNEEALRSRQEQLAALTAELSLVEERERRNIAAMLHEHIGQTLLLGKFKLGAMVVERLPEPQKKLVRETMALLDQVTREITSLTVQLNPPILAAAGLETALQWLGRSMEEDYGLYVEFEDDLREKPLTGEAGSIIYQCGRELLINVVMHANTDRARVTVGRENGNYRLTVEDDGDGFDPARLVFDSSGNRGFGLLSMRMRIERIGGRVLFDSAPGYGSRMTILTPLAFSELKKNTISVLLVDAHKLMREGLKAILDKADDIRITGEAGDGSEALHLVIEMRPDVVVMDLSTSVFSGIEATRRILEIHPDAKVLALSLLQDDECVQECLTAGAKGYLVKNCAAEELLIAIRALAAGELFLSSKVTGSVIREFSCGKAGKSFSATMFRDDLTKREIEVLKLIANGMSTKEIAYSLNVSVKTIEVQRCNIMKKLDLHSVAELTKYAVRTGLTSVE